MGEQKIHEAVGLGRPLKLLALSLSSTLVGGGGGKRGINRLKTPLNHKRAHIQCKVSKLYLSGLQKIPTWDKKMQYSVLYGAFLAIT